MIVIHCSSSLHFTTFFYANSKFASHKCIAGLITITTLVFTLSIDQSITRSSNDRLLNWSIAALTRVVVGVHIKHTSLLVQLIIVCPQCIFCSFLVSTPHTIFWLILFKCAQIMIVILSMLGNLANYHNNHQSSRRYISQTADGWWGATLSLGHRGIIREWT